VLSYAFHGAEDGPVVVHHHGTGASRLEGAIFAEVAMRHAFRVLTIDRPSYGMSTAKGDRVLVDWPEDVAAVCDHLGIASFAVSGLSGGGPHALAVASLLPERVTRAVIINSGSPTSDAEVLEQTAKRDRKVWLMARNNPARFLKTIAPLMSREPGKVTELLAKVLLPKLDRDLLDDPSRRAALDASAAEGRRQPGRRFDEALLIWGDDWGFDPYAVTVPVIVFSGEQDQGRAFNEKLGTSGNGRLESFPGGHVAFLAPDVMQCVAVAMKGA
jgi:pimeloyl-ACP methyl ester carboxylesterase